MAPSPTETAEAGRSTAAVCSAADLQRPPLVSAAVLAAARALPAEIKAYGDVTTEFAAEAAAAAGAGGAGGGSLLRDPSKIADSALELIGSTPMVRLRRLEAHFGLQCELLAKCEFMSVGGSVKDRIALRMIEEAEAAGRLTPGCSAIVEATSGNTGVGMCLVAALKGYRTIITLPEKMSAEKLNAMRALGAEIVRTPTEAAWNAPDSHIALAGQLARTVPDCHFLDQYAHPGNPRAHYLRTAGEILQQCEGRMDAAVLTAGTGGTVTGVARRLKEALPGVRIVAVDPEGSELAVPDSLNDYNRGKSYHVEGIGYDFIPSSLDRKLVDEWLKSNDRESFAAARLLIQREGLLVGGSSGAALSGAVRVARTLSPGARVVVLLPDSARNYMTKFVADEWMQELGFLPLSPPEPSVEEQLFRGRTVGDVAGGTAAAAPALTAATTIQQALAAFAAAVPRPSAILVKKGAETVGALHAKDVAAALTTGRYTPASPVGPLTDRSLPRLATDRPLQALAAAFARHEAVIVGGAEPRLLFAADFLTLLAGKV